DGDRIVLMGASLGTGVAITLAATHDAAALVLEAPYLSALDVASRHYKIFPVRWLMLDQFRSDLAIRDVHVPVVCPAKAGMFSRDQTCRGKSQSPVVWIAEVMETETLKPIDKISLGEIYESPGRNKSERIVASKV